MTDDDWIEEPAVIRRPKDKKLADAKDAKGWSRGFTPKTSTEGPQHIHIRKMREDELAPEPTVIHHYHDEEDQRPQTWGEWFSDTVAEVVTNTLSDVIEELKPHAADLWRTKAVPGLKAKVVELRQKRRDRKAATVARRTGVTPDLVVVEQTASEGEAILEVAVEGDQKITMTPEQYDQLAFMATDEFRARVVDALARAHVEEGGMPILDQLQEIKELPASQQAERVQEILSTDPAILEGLEQHIAETGHDARAHRSRRRHPQ